MKLKYVLSRTGPYQPLVVAALIITAVLSVCRIGLVLTYHDRVPGAGAVLTILGQGVRMDSVLLVYLFALPAAVAPFIEGRGAAGMIWRKILPAWILACLIFVVFMEAVTPTFIQEYDVRPNRLFLEYLVYPGEVASMLFSGFGTSIVLVVFSTTVTLIASLFIAKRYASWEPSGWPIRKKLLVWPLVALLLVAGGRSSLGHRGVNPSNVAFTDDALINDLPMSSGYSVLYAAYRMKDEADAFKLYGSMDRKAMIDTVFRDSGLPPESDTVAPDSLCRFHPASEAPKEHRNLVIILEESMGAEFVQSLGGLPLTPNLERLGKEGLWFHRLYATGTRSVRGIEAVVSGFLPTPGRSVVKLGKAQKDFFTIAELLSERGYSTRFIYGGESNFDNMKGFLLGNGFQEVIDQKDYTDPMFTSTWGVSDEDLFARAHAEFVRSEAEGRPFFSLVFTSSNHTPFELPESFKDLYESPRETVNNAVKYADYALGKFFETARQADYWKNTLFLVVADHHAKVVGDSLVPVSKFRIPGLIIGPGVTPGIYRDVASQIDLAPTLLSFMGISSRNPMPGRDLTRNSRKLPGRAIMQFYKNLAFMEDDRMVVLSPGRDAKGFSVLDGQPVPGSLDKALAQKALAHALWASWAYKEKRYRLD